MIAPGVERDRPRFGPGSLIFAARVIALAASVGSVLIVSRSLGPDLRGHVVIFAVLQLGASIIFAVGTPTAAYVATGRSRMSIRSAVSAAMSWALIVAAVSSGLGLIFSTTDTFATWLGNPGPGTAFVLGLGAGGLYLSAALTQVALGGQRAYAVAVGFAAVPVLLLVGSLVVAAAGPSTLGFMVAQAFSAVAAAGLLLVLLGQRPVADMSALRRLVVGGRPAWLGDVANVLSYRLDVLLLGWISGVGAVGIYSLSAQVLEPVWILATASANGLLISLPSLPLAAWRERTVRSAALVLVGTAAASVAAVTAFPIVLAIVGDAFQGAQGVAVLLIPGIVFLSASKVLAAYQVGLGRLWLSSLIATVSVAATTIGDLVLMPSFGPAGAAIASSIGYGLSALLWFVAFRQARTRVAAEAPA